MGEVFYWVLNMSIIATLMGVIVLLIRAIRVIPRRVTIFLWVVPFFRMCIPLSVNNPYSLMSLLAPYMARTVTVFQPVDKVTISTANTVRLADNYSPFTYRMNIYEKIFTVASWVWLVVALAIIAGLGIMYFMTLREVKGARCLRENIYLSKHVQGPVVYGIIKPRIILPVSYETEDDQYILQHENTHIRRWDNLWRVLAFLIVSVHWFNPFSWLFLKLFLTDIELSCDEAVIAKLNDEQRKEYARSLVDEAERKSLFVSAFGGAKIKTRIVNILSYKKMTVLSFMGFSALAVSILIALLTNAE